MRVCAVSFLNTVPLVWGFLKGAQRGVFDLSFSVPSVCADRLESGEVDIGIVPCAELQRLRLDYFPDVGIACHGAVRSILLISRVAPGSIRTLAVDSSSRSSVQLARIILEERYSGSPRIITMPPDLDSMLSAADAALIIGDPALRLDPAALPYLVLDLGAEWLGLSGLPMVFAVWAGRPACLTPRARAAFADSCRYGLERIEEIVRDREASHGFPADVAREYLTRYIHFSLGPLELRGLSEYTRLVRSLQTRVPDLIPAT